MSLRDRFNFDELENTAVDLVIDELEKQLIAGGRLSSVNQEIILDLSCYALNLLKPMYRSSLLGRVYMGALQFQYQNEISVAVGQAIHKIMGSLPPIEKPVE